MKIQSGSNQLFYHYQTDYMWTGHGDRIFPGHVKFETPFRNRPHVLVTLSGLDAFHGENVRVNVELRETFEDHFDVNVRTWADTKLAAVWVSWIAIDPNLFGVADEPA